MRITQQRISRIAGPEIFRRGERYFRQGAVHLDEVRPDLVTATVTDRRRYFVTLEETGRELMTSCTCPFSWGGECKHVVAVLFALLEKQEREGEPGEVDLVHRLSQGSGSASHGRRRSPAWAKSIARILEQPSPPASGVSAGPPAWRLAFSLAVDGNLRRLYPIRIRVRKDGTDGQASMLQSFLVEDLARLGRDERILLSKAMPRAELALDEDDQGHLRTWRDVSTREAEGNAGLDDYDWNDMLLLLEGKELYLRQEGIYTAVPLAIETNPGRPCFSLSEAAGELTLFPEIDWGGSSMPVSDDMTILTVRPLWILVGRRILRVDSIDGDDLRRLQRMTTPLVVPARDREAFLNNALPALLTRYHLRSSAVGLKTMEGPPVPRLYLKEALGTLALELRFRYGDTEITADPPPSDTPDVRPANGMIVTIRRDAAAEDAAAALLGQTDLDAVGIPGSRGRYTPAVDPLTWLVERLPLIRSAGFEIFGQEQLTRYRVRSGPSRIAMNVSSGIDWFDLTVRVSFEGTPASLDEFIAAVQEGKRFVRLTDGSYGMLPEEWLRRFQLTAALANKQGNGLRLGRTQAILLEDLAEAGDLTTDSTFEELRTRLRSFSGIQERPLPEGFVGSLRPYQQTGYHWLRFLQEFRFGGLLADDMGLGKTIQTLTLLQHVHADGTAPPSLIVVPTSLVYNWQREASRFTPQLRVLLYHGLDRKRHQSKFESYDLIVTSYGILRRDIEFLRSLTFTTVVLDESQNIKNFASVNSRAARHLQTAHRLALTGTPVENSLTELWSQFQFLNPGMLGGLKTFTETFIRPIERHKDEEAAASLRRIIRPFLLRRTKELVASDLPPKLESVVYCDMEEAQRSAYQHWREYYRQAILRSIETVGIRKSTVKVLEGLTKLRLVCCHPSLADERYRGSSGKFEAFSEMLEDIIAEGHRALVFSQFVRMLSILRRHLDRQGVVYEYLDGRTIHRKEHVDRFQTDESVRAFLISLRAGGTGLNLTGADYVIHYDPWWNPAVEAQATDRTHRIGQTRQVFSYKLITRDTVEEKILSLQEKKKALVSSIISTEQGFLKSLTREDIEELFA